MKRSSSARSLITRSCSRAAAPVVGSAAMRFGPRSTGWFDTLGKQEPKTSTPKRVDRSNEVAAMSGRRKMTSEPHTNATARHSGARASIVADTIPLMSPDTIRGRGAPSRSDISLEAALLGVVRSNARVRAAMIRSRRTPAVFLLASSRDSGIACPKPQVHPLRIGVREGASIFVCWSADRTIRRRLAT
jgi:hypothetical protein